MNKTKPELNKYGTAILNSASGYVMKDNTRIGDGLMAWSLMVSPGHKTAKGIVKFGNSKFSIDITFSMMFSKVAIYGIPITELCRVDDKGNSALKAIKSQVPEGHKLPRDVVSIIRGVYGVLDYMFSE